MQNFLDQLTIYTLDNFISRSELARRSELSPATITRMFNKNIFRNTTARKILKGLDMSMSELLCYRTPTIRPTRQRR